MTREFSAGGIVFNNLGQVLLVKTRSFRAYQKNGVAEYWGFPKGHIEEGQTSLEAALREVREEGGVEAEIIDKIGASKYVYTQKSGDKAFKVVTMFLMKYLSGDTSDHDHEVVESGWFSPQEALKILSFPADRELLNKALEMMKK